MPRTDKFSFIQGNRLEDLKAVRLPGLDKPFEKLAERRDVRQEIRRRGLVARLPSRDEHIP